MCLSAERLRAAQCLACARVLARTPLLRWAAEHPSSPVGQLVFYGLSGNNVVDVLRNATVATLRATELDPTPWTTLRRSATGGGSRVPPFDTEPFCPPPCWPGVAACLSYCERGARCACAGSSCLAAGLLSLGVFTCSASRGDDCSAFGFVDVQQGRNSSFVVSYGLHAQEYSISQFAFDDENGRIVGVFDTHEPG